MTFQTKVQELLSNRTNKILAGVGAIAVIVGGVAIGNYAVKANECGKTEAELWEGSSAYATVTAKLDTLEDQLDELENKTFNGGFFGMMTYSNLYAQKVKEFEKVVDEQTAITDEVAPKLAEYREGETCKLPERTKKFLAKVRKEFKF